VNAPHDFDVLVVGADAGQAGAGYRLKTECPTKTFAILEAREAIGGTWDLFRYPGVRSDSDMFTLGYPFHPWRQAEAIADGASIREYIRDTARTFGIEPHIHFRRKIVRASWSSAEARWTLAAEVTGGNGDTSEGGRTVETYRCKFLYLCSGYYRYDAAHAPRFAGTERFGGRIVHPQWWPQDLDYTGKKVVVIGSGATAVTLVPALAEKAAHVTMLQRSPSYIASLPAKDPIADRIRQVLPAKAAHATVRTKNVLMGLALYQFCRRFPKAAGKFLRGQVEQRLPAGIPMDPHFSPDYDPWDQRLCLVPNGDLFKPMRAGKADVVTDTIETFTETGLKLASGKELAADVIVTATGLELLPLGGIRLEVDGASPEPKDTRVYKGLMLSDVPNLAWCVGYTNASWTLRADLSSRYVCRLLKLMDRHGYDIAVPHEDGERGEGRPLLDLRSGYVKRASDVLPRQGERAPWYLRQNYVLDLVSMTLGRVDDAAMRFSRRPSRPAASV
jgi:monooxygenase